MILCDMGVFMQGSDRVHRYRMPVVFGPSPGPRQGPGGERYDYADAPRSIVAVSFLSDSAALETLLPPRCRLAAEPVVTVEWTVLRELEWLAGRSYSTLGVKFPVAYAGERERLQGDFLAVLWENRPEPIMSGREELGFAKLFCELPEPRILRGEHQYSARWDGHEFMRLRLHSLREGAAPADPTSPSAGVLHYRYFPKVDSKSGLAAVEEMVLTPAGGAIIRRERHVNCDAALQFLPSSWEQLPTMFQVVNALAALPIVEYRGASIAETRGAKDLSDQRILG
jgi:Acetoacetate decarboxylase (ADC)